jgi:hypothetical protein
VNAFVATGLDAAPRAASFTTAGGSASLAVTVSRVAGWDAQSLADWIEITDGNGFGAGPRTVRFSVGPNRTGGARQAGIRLGSTVVAVHQAWDPDAAPVTPTIAWAPPAPIVYGTALGGSQLNAAADTAGTFSYSPAAGTLLGAGTHTLTATFTPRDPARFTTASATTTLVVERATPVMTWNPAGALVYGMPLGAAQLNATASTSGEIAYRPAAGSLLHAGAHAVVATLTPADAANYTSVTLTRRVTVLRAPVVIRPEDASKPYGAPLPAFSAVAEGLVNGDGFAVFAGTPAFSTAATAMSAVGAYPVHVSGLEAADYTVTYAPGTLTIVPAATVLSLSSEPTPVGWNEPVTLTATVAGVATDIGVPTGSVQFFDGEVLLGSAPLESGTAVLATSVMSQGSHTITAAYSGDACFAGSSGSASQVVDLLDSASFIVLSSSASPSHYGRPVTFAAALSSSSRDVSGYVDFYDAMTPIGSAPIVRGIARLATAGLAEGGHAITARFRGNAALPPSVSPVIAQHVRDGDPVNRTPVVSVAAAGAAGSPIRLTATAAATHPEAPVGRVLFLINGVVVGEVAGTLHGTTLSAQAVAGAALAPGTYSVTAVYLGSRRYRATAASTTLTIE